MIKVKIVEIDKHRNETTFRPYIMYYDLFKKNGIEFVFKGDNYDLAWIGQASFIDRKMSYDDSVNKGIDFVNSVKGEKWLFDGQDSASMLGSYDVLKNTDAEFLLKNTLYADKKEYLKPNFFGRNYWESDYYSENKTLPDFNRVKLSGSNWLSTISPSWVYYQEDVKDIDVFAIFSYPGRKNIEFGTETSKYYNMHRERCIEWLKLLPKNIHVVTLPESGEHYPKEQYYKLMLRSKILIAPFGYGEIAPRDLEAAMFGCVLVKPDMEHIETVPKFYIPEETYFPCSWDFSNINSIIENILKNYSTRTIENSRKRYIQEYKDENLLRYIFNLFSNSKYFYYEN
jgi:hypothetical protein